MMFKKGDILVSIWGESFLSVSEQSDYEFVEYMDKEEENCDARAYQLFEGKKHMCLICSSFYHKKFGRFVLAETILDERMLKW